MRSFGTYYSWSNKGRNEKKLWSRIDRAFINLEWVHLFDLTQVDYLAEGISDHAPLKIAFLNSPKSKQSFKYCDIKDSQFHTIVETTFQKMPAGGKMYELARKLNGRRFDIHNQLAISRTQLGDTQYQLQKDPGNSQRQEREREEREKYIDILDLSTKLMRQQSKMDWINDGDHCNKFFFAKIKQRKQANYI
ncbi:LOW QUALITY PROTEIN: hypothetical protein Cgig2_016506 [Carnegiea gigantea]|uniref:Uncharacterized protein n=1 Tax=Carnegiea gigantea TaxID=171969 RepID=A0A9Q1GN53_9CARY|nr:LOW QUALITY PROTEIN: hypothetical protein Cgig2_016506 [Carnegiea gigantea]